MSADYLPHPDAAAPYPPSDWKATWIWSPDPTSGKHDYVYFRREFELNAVPEQVLLRIAAERDASLWVNGVLVDHGPPISDPRFKRYATHDITPHLATGVNCVAVRVYHDMHCGAFTDHAEARGLLCQVESRDDVILATDESWRTHVCRAYGKPGPRLGDSMWPEFFNANLDTPGWQRSGFDDTQWCPARRVLARVHPLWHEEQPQARFFPWVNLIPCETRPLQRIRHRPVALQAVGEVLQRREAAAGDVAVRMSLEPVLPPDKTAVTGPDALLRDDGGTTIRNSSLEESYKTFDGLRNATIVLDFGRLMNARLGFRISTSAAVIDIGYAYRLEEGRVVPYVSNRTSIADQYIARPGEQNWETADWRHFRYVQLSFRDVPEDVVLHEVWAEEICNRFVQRGRFRSSDVKLDRIFDMVRRTTELSVIDRTMDNPSRERKQYLGDCSGMVPAIASCFGDAAILRRYFAQACEGQKPTGAFSHSHPGHASAVPSLFDHSLSVPIRAWEHYRLFADRDLAQRMLPHLVRLLELAESCLDENDMMTLPPDSIWFDWGHMDRRGHFLPLQAMTAEAMCATAQLAAALEQPGDRWAQLAERMIARIPDWFDKQRGVFVDALVNGERQTHVSEHALSLLAMWDMGPREMIQSSLDRWAENPEAFGQTSPGWFYWPAAFVRAGRPELAIRWMHDRLDQLERQGLDTWPETWCLYGERTTGRWRCRNSRAVAQGAGLGAPVALLQDLCGIGPAEPGFATVRIVPQPGPLTSLSGTLPGPDGDYSLTLENYEAEWKLEIRLPSPRRIILDAAFAPEARQIRVDNALLEAEAAHTMPNGVAVGRFVWDAGARSSIVV